MTTSDHQCPGSELDKALLIVGMQRQDVKDKRGLPAVSCPPASTSLQISPCWSSFTLVTYTSVGPSSCELRAFA